MPDRSQLIERQQVLADFGDFAIRSEDLDDVLAEACRLVSRALGTDRAKVLEIQEGRGELLVRAGVGWAPDVVGTVRLQMNDRSSETYAIEAAEPVISQNIATETRFDIPEFMKKAGVLALVNVPIFVPGQRPYGVLQVDATTPREFGEDEIHFLRTYAMILGPVIDRLHLLDERSKTREHLRSSEARHRLLIESWAQAVWEVDANGVVVSDSPSWRAYTGQTLEEWLGHGWLGAIHPDDRAYAERQWREAVAHRAPVNAEYRLHTVEGGWRWTNVRAAPVLDAEGRVGKWAGMNIDIDARKRAVDALRESEEQFRVLADTTPALIWRNDAQGGNLFINQRFIEFTGKSAEEIRGEGWHTLIHPEDAPAYVADYLAAAKAGRAWHSTNRIRRHDGVWRWFDNHAHPLRDASGRYAGHVGASIDITDWIEAEQAVHLLQSRKSFLLELSDALRDIASAEEIQKTTTRLVGTYLGVDRSMYAEVSGERGAETGTIRTQFVRQTADGRPLATKFPDHFTFHPFGAHTMAARYHGEPLVVADVSDDPAFGSAERAAWERNGVRAAIVAPLAKAGRLVAEFGVHSTAPRHWTDEDVALVQEVAERTWAAVERARAETALRSSEERYRELFESMDEAYAVVEVLKDQTGRWADFRFVEVNPAFMTHTGMPYPVGRTATELLGQPNPRWTQLYGAALDSGEAVRVEEAEQTLDRVFDLNIFTLDREHNRVAVLFNDISERKRAEAALRASEERQRALIEGVPQLVWRADDPGNWTWASPQWTTFTGQSDRESCGWGWLEPLHPDDREIARAAWSHALDQGRFEAEYRICAHEAGTYRWFRTRATPIRDGSGKIVEWLGTSTDVDDLRRLQDRQQVLLAELQHRVRNILAVTRSIISRSDDGERSTEDYVAHLQGRIAALARTQVLLTRTAGTNVDLETLIWDELLAQVASEDQISVAGERVAISPKSAEVLTLAIHELATNATKYGAFSRPSGRLEVRWHVEVRGKQKWLMIWWQEHGVPIVDAAPRRQGFGSELIRRRIPYELKGHGSVELKPGGLQSRIEFPLVEGESILQTDAGGR